MGKRMYAFAAGAALLFVGGQAHAFTALYLSGQVWGGGSPQLFKASDGSFHISGSNGHVSISFDNSDDSHWFNLDFAAPIDGHLQVGNFDDAERYPFQSPTKPGLSVVGDGEGCNEVSGRFVIYQAVFDNAGNPIKFAADLTQSCDGSNPPLMAKIRYNSTVGIVTHPNADAGPHQLAQPGDDVTLDGSNSDAGAGHQLVSYSWTQTQGDPVILSNPDAPSPTFTAPAVPLGGEDFGFSLTVMNNAGDSSTDNTMVHVENVSDPLTYYHFESDPGDYIGQGAIATFNPYDGTFTATNLQSGRGVEIYFNGGVFNDWTMDLVAPEGQQLQAGRTYRNAQRYPFEPSDVPGLSVTGDGRGCNTLSGAFRILRLTRNGDGSIQSFAAQFVQHCEEATPALNGTVYYNARDIHVPKADAGPNQTGTAGQTITLDGSNSRGRLGDYIVGFQWTQTSGPPVTLNNADTATPSFTLPDGQQGQAFGFQLVVTDNMGYMDADDTQITEVAAPTGKRER